MSTTVAWGVFAGVTLGLGLWMLASLVPHMNRPRLSRRIAPYLTDISPGARESLAPPAPGPLPVLAALVEPVTSRAVSLLGSILGGAPALELRLRQSGSGLTVNAFRARQLMSGLAGAAAGVAMGVIAGRTWGAAPWLQAAIVVLGFAAGVVLCDYILQAAARKRLERLSSELPVVLEFLTLSLSAGEGILDAIRRVSRISGGELSRELAGVIVAVNSGLPFGDTLVALAATLELPAFSRCVQQIVGALDRGTPLAEVLRAQAQDSRDDAKRALLELAGKKELAMMFPLVFLILPITIAFAIFPGIFVLQVGF